MVFDWRQLALDAERRWMESERKVRELIEQRDRYQNLLDVVVCACALCRTREEWTTANEIATSPHKAEQNG